MTAEFSSGGAGWTSRLQLSPLLAAAVLLSGCSADLQDSTSDTLGPQGASLDLLCDATLGNGDGEVSPDGCCGDTGALCAMVGGEDRRRSVWVPDGQSLTLNLPALPAGEIRFSMLIEDDSAAAVELELLLEAGGRSVTKTYSPTGTAWSDFRLPLDALDEEGGVLELSAAGAAVAVGMLRHVRIDSPGIEAAGHNVLVYLIDTLRPDHMSIYGYERETTPRIDEFFERGWVFENAYSTASWTRPGTASLLTSLYPGFHGANIGGLVEDPLTMAEAFRAAGFSTWAFVTNANVFAEGLGYDRGFDRFVSVRGARRSNHARTEEVNAVIESHLELFGDEPFFMYVHTVDPHEPYDPPEEYRGLFTDPNYDGPIEPKQAKRRVLRTLETTPADRRFVRGLYDEDIRYQDEMFGEFVENLGQHVALEKLVTVLTSDHGEELFEHGDWGHGQRMWEVALRIPMLVRADSLNVPGQLRRDARVQLIDVMPTFLDLFGLEGMDRMQGENLRPLLTDEIRDATLSTRELYFEEPRTRYSLHALGDGARKSILRREYPPEMGGAEGVEPVVQLFDLVLDPLEQQDLSTTMDNEARAFVRRMAAWNDAFVAKGFIVPDAQEEPVLDAATVEQLRALGYVN